MGEHFKQAITSPRARYYLYLIQGMNYVAALLLLIIEKEEYVFWLMVSVIEDFLPEYYSNSLIGFRADMGVLDVLIK